MRNTASLFGPLEQSIMACFWASGSQTSTEILATLRERRTIVHTTVTTTFGRLYEQGLLTREPSVGQRNTPAWRYTARYTARGALLAGAVERLCVQFGADRGDRALALAVLLGTPL